MKLKENINREIREVRSETLKCIMVQILERVGACEAENGCRLSDVSFRVWCRSVAKFEY